jgi:ribose-phosphate pyrophosphokinase
MAKIKIISTTATKYLFNKINGDLKQYKLEHIVEKFSDGELSVKFPESVRNCNLYLIAANSKPEDIVETMLTLDAAHLASANKVILFLPYFGYSRQDRQEGYRGSFGAKYFARLFTNRDMAKLVDRVVSIDLHAEQIQGFFDTPCEHIKGHSYLLDAVKKYIDEDTWLCAPDAGASKRVEKWMAKLGVPMVTINKFRNKPNEISRMELTSDVSGKRIILLDDIADTFGTVAKAAAHLKEKGAKEVIAGATHPLLSGKAYDNINNSVLDGLIFSDTIWQPFFEEPSLYLNKPVEIVSCVPTIEQIITRLISNESVSELNY